MVSAANLFCPNVGWACGDARALIDKGIAIPYKKSVRHALSGRNSAVECQLPKLDVTGSIPVARSIFMNTCNIQTV
jgi:hypothetical protein